MFVAAQPASEKHGTSGTTITTLQKATPKCDLPESEVASEVESDTDSFTSSENEFASKGPEKFWISKDLFISKEKSTSAVTVESESQSVTCQKIDYNCAVVREHSQKCSCITPRLHIYLMFGHQCNTSCANRQRLDDKCADIQEIPVEAIKEEREESDSEEEDIRGIINEDERDENGGAEIAVKVENEVMDEFQDNSELLDDESGSESGNLTIDTEYVVVSDDILKLSPPVSPVRNSTNHDKNSREFKLGKHLNNNNDVISKHSLKKKRKVNSIKNKNCTKTSVARRKKTKTLKISSAIKILNTCALSSKLDIKDEPEEITTNDLGILANDFQQELQTIAQSLQRRKMITVAKAKPSQDALNLLENFESLIKEEPERNIGDEALTKSEAGVASFHVSDIFEKEEEAEILGTTLEVGEKKKTGSFTIKDRSLESKKGKVVRCVNNVSPTKLKILFSALKESSLETVKCEPDLLESDDDRENDNEYNLRKLESDFLMTGSEDIDETKDSLSQFDNFKSNVSANSRENQKKAAAIRKWKCNLCSKKFSTFEILSDHLENHQKDGLILCFYCQKSFGDRTSMKRHMRSHTGERPYQCKVCGKRFSLPGNFKKHRDIHEDIRSEPCEVCGKTFRRREHLKYHMRTHTGEKPFICSLCPSSFTARYSLQIHMNIHLGKKPYKCSYCNKAFCDKSTMRKHIRTHTGERPFKCKLCFKGFSESGTLASHMATHTEDRPFSCTKCELKFKTNGGLRQHSKIHTGVKHFECKYCGMRFLQRYNMTMHERIHTNEKPYSCCECSRCFRSRSCLAKHIVIHAGDQERKHSCSHCEKKFFRKAHLNRHINMHLGVKEYECEVCSKTFCSKATLRGHTRTFHTEGARKFPCENCGKVFKRQIYVSTHKCSNKENDENDDATESEETLSIKIENEGNEIKSNAITI